MNLKSPDPRTTLSGSMLPRRRPGCARSARWAVIFLAVFGGTALRAGPLTLRENSADESISVFRPGGATALLTQNAPAEARPYLHPIAAPDGRGVLTEFRPAHHPHQTGLDWGLTRLNGRDYFQNGGAGYWRRVALRALVSGGEEVKWSTEYELLGADGTPVLRETQIWSMRDTGDRYLLGLEWLGQGLTDVTVSKYHYDGLFLRMPWRADIGATAVNSNRQRDAQANGRRAIWIDVGMKIAGRDDEARIAIFDHPENDGFP